MFSKTVLVTFVFAMCAVLAMADDHEGKCWIESDKKEYSPGDEWSPAGQCSLLTCHIDGSISGKACAAEGVPPGYHVQESSATSWPACCPTVVKD